MRKSPCQGLKSLQRVITRVIRSCSSIALLTMKRKKLMERRIKMKESTAKKSVTMMKTKTTKEIRVLNPLLSAERR